MSILKHTYSQQETQNLLWYPLYEPQHQQGLVILPSPPSTDFSWGGQHMCGAIMESSPWAQLSEAGGLLWEVSPPKGPGPHVTWCCTTMHALRESTFGNSPPSKDKQIRTNVTDVLYLMKSLISFLLIVPFVNVVKKHSNEILDM